MAENMEPCPFCRSTKVHIRKDPDIDTDGYFYFYKCGNCGVRTREKYATETCPNFFAELRDLWNIRAPAEPHGIAEVWEAIDSAPKDGTKFDAWCVRPGGSSGVRIPDVQMRGDGSGFGFVVHLKDGVAWQYLDARNRDEAIFPPWIPTHWRSRPEGPEAQTLPGSSSTRMTEPTANSMHDRKDLKTSETGLAFKNDILADAAGLRLCKLGAGDELLLSEDVIFKSGRSAILTTLQRANLAGHVGGTIDKKTEFWADQLNVHGDTVGEIKLDRGSWNSLKNRWMRCKMLHHSEKSA